MIFEMILQMIYGDIILDYIWEALPNDDTDDCSSDKYGNDNDNGDMMLMIMMVMTLW